MSLKYIIFNLKHPVIFADFITHKDMAEAVRRAACRAGNTNMVPTSAGFCSMEGQAWGESISLNIKSDTNDAQILAQHPDFMPY